MAEAEFELAYDGEAVADGTMDVRHLATALLAVGGIIQAANKALNGGEVAAQVRVRPGTREGSAIVSLVTDLSFVQHAQVVLGTHGVHDARQVLGLLGFLGQSVEGATFAHSLISFYKMVKARLIVGKEVQKDGSVQFNLGDGSTLSVGGDLNVLIASPSVTKHLAGLIAVPLSREGITDFKVIGPGDQVLERVTKAEAEFFRPTQQATTAPESYEPESGEFEAWVTVRKSWNVEPRNKWQFAHGNGAPFNAVVTDLEFWKQIDRDAVPTTKHTKFRVHVNWTESPDGGEHDFEIDRVLEWEPPDKDGQITLLAPDT